MKEVMKRKEKKWKYLGRESKGRSQGEVVGGIEWYEEKNDREREVKEVMKRKEKNGNI